MCMQDEGDMAADRGPDKYLHSVAQTGGWRLEVQIASTRPQPVRVHGGRVVRAAVLRIVKLFKFFKMVLEDESETKFSISSGSFNLSNGTKRLISLLILTLLVTHTIACLWIFTHREF